jgi:hypothetical protein
MTDSRNAANIDLKDVRVGADALLGLRQPGGKVGLVGERPAR